jgi:(p)ppGpp synthase/HD superfamily hydrolase
MSHALVKDTISRAIKLASSAHKNDKWGELPYTVHLALVANEIRLICPERPILEAAAWLHDVIEDHPEYAEEVKNEFPEVYDIVRMVSRVEGETYSEFIQRILDSYDDDAIMLKLADMRVNLGNLAESSKVGLRERYEKHIGSLEKRVSTMWQ